MLSEIPCSPARSNFFGVYDCWASVANGSLLGNLLLGGSRSFDDARARTPAGSRSRRAANKQHRARPGLPQAAPPGAVAAAAGTRTARACAKGFRSSTGPPDASFPSSSTACKPTASSSSGRRTVTRRSGWRSRCRPPAASGRSTPTWSAPRSPASYFRRAGVEDRIEIINQPALEVLRSFPQRNLDIVFIDAIKTEYEDYFDAVVPMLKRSGIVVIDNLLWSGRAAAAPKSSDDEHDRRDPRLQQDVSEPSGARCDDRSDRRRNRHRCPRRLKSFSPRCGVSRPASRS